MKERVLISPSILAAPHDSKAAVQRAVNIAERGGADLLHIDVMDGKFVPQLTLWNDPKNIRSIKTTLPLDVHIMIANPDERYLDFVNAGAKMLSFHIEATKDPEKLLSKLHQSDVKAGIAINPETPIEKLLPYLPLIDYVLVMSVRPGRAGQQFIPGVLEKLVTIKQQRPDIHLQVDGGINKDTVTLVAAAGASIIVSGATIYNAEIPEKMITSLRRAAQKSF